MLNKAMLLACMGKKKEVVPTNGTFFSKFSIVPEDFYGDGSFVGVMVVQGESEQIGQYELISGSDMLSEQFWLYLAFDLCLLSSPHVFDENVDSTFCALVNENSGEIFYGFCNDEGWVVMFKSYEDARFVAGNGLPEGMEVVYPFSLADVGKTLTFSFYICD